jgi:endonuclease/exonuclease/phosphatase family metal-dependent hydrolase
MHRFRIATYNVHKCRGVDGRVHPERIARVLEELHADIVCLQEVVSHEGGARADHQADYLAGRLGLIGAMGETRKHRGGVYGNLTLSRSDFKLVRPIDLTIGAREQRVALRTDIRLGGHVLHIFNVHLGTAVRERRQQAMRLVDRDLLRAIDISGPRMVLGDFNEWIRGLVTKTHGFTRSSHARAQLSRVIAHAASGSHLFRPSSTSREGILPSQPAIHDRFRSLAAGG